MLVSKILVSAENKNGSGSSKRVFMKSYQQRDKNSIKNIKKLVQCVLNKKERPKWYRRDIKLPE